MAAEFVVHIDPEHLRIEDRKAGTHLEFPNRVVVEKRRGLILSLGEDEDAVRARFGDRFPAGEIATLTVFGADDGLLAYELRVIGHLTRLLANQSGGTRSVSALPSKPGKGGDYLLDVPGYETFPAARRHSLEYALQAQFRLRRLAINGRELQIPARNRELEVQLWRVSSVVLPAVAAIVGYIAAPVVLRADRFAFLLYILLILLLVYYGGRVAWMFLARRIVPVRYCLYMLMTVRHRHSPIDRWLAHAIWGATLAE